MINLAFRLPAPVFICIGLYLNRVPTTFEKGHMACNNNCSDIQICDIGKLVIPSTAVREATYMLCRQACFSVQKGETLPATGRGKEPERNTTNHDTTKDTTGSRTGIILKKLQLHLSFFN